MSGAVANAVTLAPGAELCHLPAALRLVHGGMLDGAVLAYERQGPPDAPVVVVLGGISAGRHVSAHAGAPGPGWWEGIVGEGLAIDTRRRQVLAIDWLGGAGASTGPADDAGFPFVATEDQADALARLLDHLQVPAVHALVGCSYGGMVGLQFAARHARRLGRLVAIGAAHRSHPLANAWRAVQRGIVELGLQHGCGRQALALARSLAMTTYRSAAEFADRFAGAPAITATSVRFPVQDWLDARGAEFAARCSPAAFLCLNQSIDAHRLDPAAVRVPVHLVSFDSDQLVPREQVRALAAALPRLVAHKEVHTRYGHDGFLVESAALRPLLAEALLAEALTAEALTAEALIAEVLS